MQGKTRRRSKEANESCHAEATNSSHETEAPPHPFEGKLKTEAHPFEGKIEKFKSCHEPKHQWELKKRFMMAHRDSFHLMELVGLAQTFGNIEFLGCTYPLDTMRRGLSSYKT